MLFRSFDVTVTPVNDAPTITALADQTIAEDGTTGPLAFSVSDVETAAGSLTVTAGQGNGNHSNVTLSVSASSTNVTSTPGGSTDFYYMPSYVSSSTYSNPGVGGYTTTTINGTAGAVVLIW